MRFIDITIKAAPFLLVNHQFVIQHRNIQISLAALISLILLQKLLVKIKK